MIPLLLLLLAAPGFVATREAHPARADERSDERSKDHVGLRDEPLSESPARLDGLHAEAALADVDRDPHRALVAGGEERLQTELAGLGYPSVDAFAAAARKQGRGPVLDFVADERNFDLAMNQPEQARDGIASAGILNLFQVDRPDGVFHNRPLRNQVEAALLGVPLPTYTALAPALKPHYGYLRTAATASATLPVGSQYKYGGDTYVFKKPQVRDNLTFTEGDSLGDNFRASDFHSQWSHRFLPWRDRALLAVSRTLGGGTLARAPSSQVKGVTANLDRSHRYIELQYWKPLEIKDVEAFEFTGAPPSGAFLEKLRAHGVAIFHQLPGGGREPWRGAGFP